jgi:hypothetical protein
MMGIPRRPLRRSPPAQQQMLFSFRNVPAVTSPLHAVISSASEYAPLDAKTLNLRFVSRRAIPLVEGGEEFDDP